MPLDTGPERRDNIIPFPQPEKTSEQIHTTSGTHEESMAILKEMGYSSIDEARNELATLKQEKEGEMLSFLGRIKDKVFNHGEAVGKITKLESRINKLARVIKAAHATEQAENASQNEDGLRRTA